MVIRTSPSRTPTIAKSTTYSQVFQGRRDWINRAEDFAKAANLCNLRIKSERFDLSGFDVHL
jgi:hypothetical protein